MTTPLSPAGPDHDRTGANAPTEDFSVNAADDASATANLLDTPTVPYPESGLPPRGHDTASSSFALLAVASTSATWKYGSQFGGTFIAFIWSFMAIMPACGVSPTLNSV